MDFYTVEQSLDLVNQIQKRILYNGKYLSFGFMVRETMDLLNLLNNLFKSNFFEPRITKLILIKKDLYLLLDSTIEQAPELVEKLSKVIVEKVPFIKEALASWNDLFSRKIKDFITGNQYLKNLPKHENADMFYIMIKELNPVNIIVRHPYTEVQTRIQAKRQIRELLSFDKDDPITARRIFDPDDRLNAPGSSIRILEGHHRLYELYRRYLRNKINGNELIEAVKG